MSQDFKSPSSSSEDLFIENPFLEKAFNWLSHNKSFLVWILAGLIALIFAFSRILSNQTSQAEADFMRAQFLFSRFQVDGIRTPKGTENDLKELLAILKKHPELGPKYEGQIAQTLLIAGKLQEADTLIGKILTRTNEDHLSLYKEFDETTLLIDKGEYSKALEISATLEESLEKNLGKKEVPILYLVNQLRIAMLNQFLGNKEGERKAWEAFSSEQGKEALFLESILSFGESKLSDYIKQRQAAN